MTAILERRENSSLWARFCEWITSTENRLYIGWFGVIMIPCLLTATSVFIIAFIAAPPVDIDGIREPVSGSLLYGNNISAPRSYFVRHEKWTHWDYNMCTAPSLGWRVTLTPEMAPAENSTLGKANNMTNVHVVIIRELRNLWSKLYCLKNNTSEGYRSAQILSVVSCQHVDYVRYCHIKTVPLMMMFIGTSLCFNSPLMRGTESNGRPKGFMPVKRSRSNWIKRQNKTTGSPKASPGENPSPVMDSNQTKPGDGAPIVLSSKASSRKRYGTAIGSGAGDSSVANSDAAIADPPNAIPPEVAVKALIGRWKHITKVAKGVAVPAKLQKLEYLCANIAKDKAQPPTKKVRDIYQILLDPEIYNFAYDQIKSNPGNMTEGADGTTLDGWGTDDINRIIDSLKNESFDFAKAKLVEIPKPQGGKRGIKIAPPKDKVVQRVITYILETIYEPTFAEESFGFRFNQGCHDALKHVQTKFQGARWFIEGDISKCFDEIDHHILIDTLRERIDDERFIRLIWKALRAGYLDTWKVPQDCIVGTPQGSIVSPILCNIFMDKFDRFVLKLRDKYTRGQTRSQPPEYKRLMASSNYYSKRYKTTKDPTYLTKATELRKQAQTMPSMVTDDPNFRRFYYVRYADDWLVGFAGPREEAEQIRDSCKEFLTSIKLRLNMEKTLISPASDGCVFLGTRIHVPLNQLRFKQGTALKSRANLGVRLNAPLDRVIRKLHLTGFCDTNGIGQPKFSLYVAEPDEMVGLYGSVIRGYLNYYSFADNYKKLASAVFYILRASLCKLIAAKYKLKSVKQVLRKYGKFVKVDEKVQLPDYNSKVVRGELFKTKTVKPTRVTALTLRARLAISAARLSCTACGSTVKVEMHHVRQLKDLNKKLDVISLAMAARKRKQIPLCRICHMNKHKAINAIRRGLSTE